MWHSLLTTMIHYFPYKPLYICTLHTKVKCARFPVLKIRWFLIFFKFKHLHTNPVAGGHVRTFKRTPADPENINAHLAYWCYRLPSHHGWPHDQVPAHNCAVELNGLINIRNRVDSSMPLLHPEGLLTESRKAGMKSFILR